MCSASGKGIFAIMADAALRAFEQQANCPLPSRAALMIIGLPAHSDSPQTSGRRVTTDGGAPSDYLLSTDTAGHYQRQYILIPSRLARDLDG